MGFPGDSVVKNPLARCRKHGFDWWVGKIPCSRKWQPTPVFLPGKSQGQRSLVGYSPWGHNRTVNFQMFKLVLEKAKEPEIKLPTSAGLSKEQESSRKTSISPLLTMPKPLTVWITINCGKFWKRWEYQSTWPASWEICMQVWKQQLEMDMEQQTGSK